MNQNNRAKKPLRVYWDEDLDKIVQHCINPSRRDNPIKLRKKRLLIIENKGKRTPLNIEIEI